jgi:hypothetical protein
VSGDSPGVEVLSQPPVASIAAPASGATYRVGQRVPTSFDCQDAAGHPGIASCLDGNRAPAPHGRLNTSAPGLHTYTVTAVSKDGESGQAQISYTVVRPPAVAIRGRVALHPKRVSVRLACIGGSVVALCRGTVSLLRPGGRG